MKIGYKIFGKSSLNYGLSLCLQRNNINAELVTINTAYLYDVVLFSVFWWQHAYDFVDFCDKARIGKHLGKKPRIIVGGFNSFNPTIFKKYAHQVCVGDGETVILPAIKGEHHPSIYTGIEKSVVYNNDDISNNDYIYYNEAKIARIEIARGCKYKCSFCQLSALKKYREVKATSIERALCKVKNKRTALFAPNKTSHSEYDKITELLKSSGKVDVVPDVRFNDVEKFYTQGTIQIGVEGLSERLRYSVGKKLSNDRLREIIKYIIKKGLEQGHKPHIHTGFIFDLPGESDDDFREFSGFLDDLQTLENINKFCWFFVFNLFMPSPFTPLELDPIHIDCDYTTKMKRVLSKNRTFAVQRAGRFFSNYNRVLSMIATRGGEEFSDIAKEIDKSIIKEIPDSKKIVPLKFLLKKYGGIEKYIQVPTSKPWRIVDLNSSIGEK